MSNLNHRRKNKKARNIMLSQNEYNNGFGLNENEEGGHDGTPSYLDKSRQCWLRKSKFSDKIIGASVGASFSKGNRGMAKDVRGAKKFIRSRVRFHEQQKLNKIKREYSEEEV